MLYSFPKLQALLDQYGFLFKKNFGQNFIIDENIIKKIIEISDVNQNVNVLEIGPGAGSLTYYLAQYAKSVTCYEIDSSLKSILDTILKPFSNVDVIYEDFLKADVASNLKKNDGTYKVVANLPYYITTPILMKIIEDNLPVDQIVVMVQKEVGNRFKAQPGSKDYSSLSIFLQYYFEIEKKMDVSRHVFLPKPNVDSIVISFKRREFSLKVIDEKFFFQLIRDAFKQKRKTIRNNLKEYDLEELEKILKEFGYDLSVRAEQLSLEQFVILANHLSSKE